MPRLSSERVRTLEYSFAFDSIFSVKSFDFATRIASPVNLRDDVPHASSLKATVAVDSLPVLVLMDFGRFGHFGNDSLILSIVIIPFCTRVSARWT